MKKGLSVALLLAGGLAAWPSAVRGATLVSDPFTDGNRDQSGTTNDPQGIKWYNQSTFQPSASQTSVSVGPDATIGSGNALVVGAGAASTSNVNRVVGAFAATPTQLLAKAGDAVTLDFDFRITQLPAAGTNVGLRFGLGNSNASTVTADQTGVGNNGTNSDNDTGYLMGVALGTTTGNNSNLFYDKAASSDGLGTGTFDNLLASPNGTFGINDTNAHHARLVVSLTGTGSTVSVTGTIDPGTGQFQLVNNQQPTALLTSFDEIFMDGVTTSGSTGSIGFNVDNVTLTATPEPGGLGLLLAGGAASLLARRRRIHA